MVFSVAIQLWIQLQVFLFISIGNFGFRLGYARQFTILKLALCLAFQGTRLPVWEKFNSNVAAKCEYIFSDFYWLI